MYRSEVRHQKWILKHYTYIPRNISLPRGSTQRLERKHFPETRLSTYRRKQNKSLEKYLIFHPPYKWNCRYQRYFFYLIGFDAYIADIKETMRIWQFFIFNCTGCFKFGSTTLLQRIKHGNKIFLSQIGWFCDYRKYSKKDFLWNPKTVNHISFLL